MGNYTVGNYVIYNAYGLINGFVMGTMGILNKTGFIGPDKSQRPH